MRVERKRSVLFILLALVLLAITLRVCRREEDPTGSCPRLEQIAQDTLSAAITTPEQTTAPSAEGDDSSATSRNEQNFLRVEPDPMFEEVSSLWYAADGTEGVKVHFRQGSAILDKNYKRNSEALGRLAEMLQPYATASKGGRCKVRILSSVSPEGSNYINSRLIEGRAKAIADWISAHFDVETDYTLDSMGVDWAMLIDLVERSERVPYKEEVLDVLRNIPERVTRNGRMVNEREMRLKTLRGGEPYAYIYRNLYPHLRYAAAYAEVICEEEVVADTEEVAVPEVEVPEEQPEQVVTPEEPTEQPEQEEEVLAAEPEQEIVPEEPTEEVPTQEPAEEPAPQPRKSHFEPIPFHAAVKTNALYDVALIPNIGAEVQIGDHFSIGANWHWAWWSSDSAKWYWRTYGGDVSARYWFGEAARREHLAGHHIGIYGQIVTYDFLVGKRGILADRWSWDAGVEYGYSLPLNDRLSLDCTIGVGYHTGIFYEYMPVDTHYVWQATKNRHYFGPTKFEMSLVWHFGNKRITPKNSDGR